MSKVNLRGGRQIIVKFVHAFVEAGELQNGGVMAGYVCEEVEARKSPSQQVAAVSNC